MFFRYFFVLSLVVLFAVVIGASDSEENEERNPAVAIVVRIIGRLFAKAAKNCLREAAEQCKGHARNPGAALSCGRDFLAANKGRCVIG